jgi:hypothetical protein
MIYTSSWVATAITTSGSGVISYAVSPSIASSSEYSLIQSLFTEVRLLRAQFQLSPRQSNSTSVAQNSIVLGTDMAMNGTTFTNPASSSAVTNCLNMKRVFTGAKTIPSYEMPVPRDLDYSSLATTADIPTLPDPSIGCPGMVLVYADGLANSTTYFDVACRARQGSTPQAIRGSSGRELAPVKERRSAGGDVRRDAQVNS